MLIDRDKAIEALGEEPEVWCDTVETLDEYSVGARNQWQRDVDAIKALPSAEPQIIRCKDCKYYLNSNEKCGLIDTRLYFYETNKRWGEDCFCSWAERRTE